MSSSILQAIQSLQQPVSKRTRLNNPVMLKSDEKDENYISATEFENFCENDLISDLFSVISKKILINNPDNSENFKPTPSESLKFLFEKGVEHEDNIINKLREITQLPLEKHTSVKTSRDYDTVNKSIEKKDYDKVISSIKNGDPFIYSGYICDKKEDGSPEWRQLILTDMILILKTVQNAMIRELTKWKSDNCHKFDDNDKISILFNKAIIKLMSISFTQDNTLSRIKNSLYNYLKRDLKSVVDFEFEFN
jgi:hypothetical protein